MKPRWPSSLSHQSPPRPAGGMEAGTLSCFSLKMRQHIGVYQAAGLWQKRHCGYHGNQMLNTYLSAASPWLHLTHSSKCLEGNYPVGIRSDVVLTDHQTKISRRVCTLNAGMLQRGSFAKNTKQNNGPRKTHLKAS